VPGRTSACSSGITCTCACGHRTETPPSAPGFGTRPGSGCGRARRQRPRPDVAATYVAPERSHANASRPSRRGWRSSPVGQVGPAMQRGLRPRRRARCEGPIPCRVRGSGTDFNTWTKIVGAAGPSGCPAGHDVEEHGIDGCGFRRDDGRCENPSSKPRSHIRPQCHGGPWP